MTACAIVIAQVFMRWMAGLGWIDASGIPSNFEGYAGNRNAFAFQMLACSALLITWSRHYRKAGQRLHTSLSGKWNALFIFSHGVLLAALVFSASRAGIGTGIAMLVLAWAARLGERRMLLFSVICAGILWAFVVLVLPLLSDVVNIGAGNNLAKRVMAFRMSNEASNVVRWETIRRGLEMWLEAPLLGAGLGVFIEKSTLWFKQAIVIHCTPVWILAEFGLLGALALMTIFLKVFISAYRVRSRSPVYRAVMLLLVAFAIFGLVHDIFYQRIFWLVLGICLALPFRSHDARKIAHG
ncbi:MAG: O-antigen ligase family protein [Zoogloeaceae bacterium]|nr:O-antigen ligase family protein [Zoogloeaceae bacterium]